MLNNLFKKKDLGNDSNNFDNERPNIPDGMWVKCDNCGSILYNEDLKKMEVYFQEHNYYFMLIINGCNELRPQRTWGAFPTFLKPTSGYYPITKDYTGGFIFNIRPEFSYDLDSNNTLAVTTEFQALTNYKNEQIDSTLIGIYWRYKN